MLDEVLFARGTLVATQPGKINPETDDLVRRALNDQTLWWISLGYVSDGRIIAAQSGIALASDDLFPEGTEHAEPHDRAKRFASAMKRALEAEGVAELKVEGSLVITVDTEEDVYVARLIFRNSEIFFQEAESRWLIETPV